MQENKPKSLQKVNFFTVSCKDTHFFLAWTLLNLLAEVMNMQYDDELERIASQFIKRKVSLEEAKNKLIMLVYSHPEAFGLGRLNKDTMHSFLLWTQKRIVQLLENYNSEISSFATYFRQSIYLCKKTFLRRLASNNAREQAMMELSPLEEEAHEYQYNATEYSLTCCADDHVLEGACVRYKDFATNLFDKKGVRWSTFEMKENLRKAACLILTLKACCYVDADIIRKVSSITKLSEEDITVLLDEVKKKVDRKIQKREYCIKSRDAAFYFHRRYRVESERIERGTDLSSSIQKRYERQTKIWKARVEQLKTPRYMAIPSNTDLAEVLNISSRKIERILHTAEKNIDTISLKDYDSSHETLSCNGQRKQKEGNEANS